MAELEWDLTGERTYETGVDHGVLYTPDGSGVYNDGVAWNGLTTVTESPTGAEANAKYADNIKYLNLISAEQFEATLEALTYPVEFEAYDGLSVPSAGVTVGQQIRKTFGLSYRTIKGNDIEGDAHGYKIHLLYGLTAAPSEKAYATINDSPDAIAFSWKLSSIPVAVTGLRPASVITIDSTEVDADALLALEEILYGSVSDDPRLPLPDEVIALFEGTPLATNVVVAGDADSIDITGTTTNYLFTVSAWDGDSYAVVSGGTNVNEAAAEALTLANGVHKVTLTAAGGYYVPVAQQTTFIVNVT